MINMDATLTDIGNKTYQELRQLQRPGSNVFTWESSAGGWRSGLYAKGPPQSQGVSENPAHERGGASYNAHIMTGIADKERGLENAHALADFFNGT